MGDMGDDFRAWREHKQKKRASNREDSAQLLKGAGISFDTNNGGVHLIVVAQTAIVDFWPGTGLWIPRTTKKRSYGVRNLIDFCKKG